MAEVLDELLVAGLPPPGANWAYTYTLATRTGEALRLAEERFGPRDKAFTPLGVEFCETGPRLWLPTLGSGHVVIQLSTSAMGDRVRAYFQLAHECVHLLDPRPWGAASVFEEGAASLLGLEYARRFWTAYPGTACKYATAAELAAQALAANPSVVRQLRAGGTPFSDFTADQLVALCPGLPVSMATVLCRSFLSWGGEA